MSYIGPNPMGLYEVSQNKTIPPEHLMYLQGQLPSGVPLPAQYLQQNLHQNMPPPQLTMRQAPQVSISFFISN